MSSLEINQTSLDDLQLLTDMSQLLTVLDLDTVLQHVVEMSIQLVGATHANLFLLNGQEIDWQHIVNTDNIDPEHNLRLVLQAMENGLASWVIRGKKALIVSDTQTDARWYTDEETDQMTGSALCVPFITDNQVIAVLTLMHTEPNYFTPYHQRLITIIANQVIVAIRQAQMFNRLQGQESQLKTILHTIPAAILVLDADACIELVNKAALPLLGNLPPEQLIGQSLINLQTTDSTLNPVQEIIQEIGSGLPRAGTQWTFEARSKALEKDLQVSILVWEDQVKDTTGYVIVMNDITQLRDLHRFKDEMLQVASHDLRSPLSLIMGYIEMIALDLPEDDSPLHEYLDTIRHTASRMNDLLDDLLRVERIRTSPLELHEMVDPEKLLKVVTVNMRPFAIKKDQDFVVEIDLPQPIGLMADPVLIRQAMENLINNAIKHTPQGGHITTRAYVEEEYFCFEVQDTGIGIPANDLPHIFDSFYRVKSPNMAGIKGAGLGLSLVKTVIERHHGKVWVESVPGEGSCFYFSIPLSTTAAQ